MATELIKAKRRYGMTLVITDQYIRIGKGSNQRTLARASLTGVDSREGVASFLGIGGHMNLFFHGQGSEVLKAEWVKPNEAREILSLLGY